jgi:hypothetical protein
MPTILPKLRVLGKGHGGELELAARRLLIVHLKVKAVGLEYVQV